MTENMCVCVLHLRDQALEPSQLSLSSLYHVPLQETGHENILKRDGDGNGDGDGDGDGERTHWSV